MRRRANGRGGVTNVVGWGSLLDIIGVLLSTILLIVVAVIL
jgi:hypothetical protein